MKSQHNSQGEVKVNNNVSRRKESRVKPQGDINYHKHCHHSDSPKHLLWLVARSTNTFAEMTFPKGRNICSISESVNSCGRW